MYIIWSIFYENKIRYPQENIIEPLKDLLYRFIEGYNHKNLELLNKLIVPVEQDNFKEFSDQLKVHNLFIETILIHDICKNLHDKNGIYSSRYINYHFYRTLKLHFSTDTASLQNEINAGSKFPRALKWILKNNMKPDQETINNIYSDNKYFESQQILSQHELYKI